VNTQHWLRQARRAARELRARGAVPPLPLGEAFYLDRLTAQLLESLVGLGILEAEDLSRIGAGPAAARRRAA
jgi:hypothetical protein